jgi:hypothetical protein
MPMTPDVARPIGRRASSSARKRIDCAVRLTSSRSSSALMRAAAMSSSSSRRLSAISPLERPLSNSVSAVFFTRPVLGGQHQVRRDRVVLERDDLRDRLVRLEGQDVGHVLAARVAVGLGQLVRLGPVDPALVGEEQQPVVRRRHEEVLDDVVLLQAAPCTPRPPRRCER